MDGPLNARKRADSCSECGETTGARGAWGLCNKHYKSRRYAVIKDALIEAMGGACSRCAGCFHRSVFDFHHVGEKTDAPSAVLQNGAPAEIAAEMARCVLLCANCHRLEHHDAGL